VCVPHAGLVDLRLGDRVHPIDNAQVVLNTFHGGTGQPGSTYDPDHAMEFGPHARNITVENNNIFNYATCGTKIDPGATVIYQHNIFGAGNGANQEMCP